ncbi:MAG: GGDEF domain-containing protein [Candidatus Omnitrophica bacterium]|nr:GGDEF domain-containing protein [Candidatus Omnitrophota bacterium]
MVNVFSSNLRSTDLIYRYGGEEFTVLLPETDRKSAFIVAENLRRIVENTVFEGEEKSRPGKKITVSIGVAEFPSDAQDRDNLIKMADEALYCAKQKGRNRVCIMNLNTFS